MLHIDIAELGEDLPLAIVARVEAWRGEADASDDVTLVLMKVLAGC